LKEKNQTTKKGYVLPPEISIISYLDLITTNKRIYDLINRFRERKLPANCTYNNNNNNNKTLI